VGSFIRLNSLIDTNVIAIVNRKAREPHCAILQMSYVPLNGRIVFPGGNCAQSLVVILAPRMVIKYTV